MTVWVAPVLLASAGLLAPLPWVCRRPGDVSGPVIAPDSPHPEGHRTRARIANVVHRPDCKAMRTALQMRKVNRFAILHRVYAVESGRNRREAGAVAIARRVSGC